MCVARTACRRRRQAKLSTRYKKRNVATRTAKTITKAAPMQTPGAAAKK